MGIETSRYIAHLDRNQACYAARRRRDGSGQSLLTHPISCGLIGACAKARSPTRQCAKAAGGKNIVDWLDTTTTLSLFRRGYLVTCYTYEITHAWWRHQMETFSALQAICAGISPVPGEFPTQRPVTRSFDVHFDLRPNKRLSKHSWGWWFETASCPLWRHRNGTLHIFIHNLYRIWLVLLAVHFGPKLLS